MPLLQTKLLLCSQQTLPFASSSVSEIHVYQRNENCEEKQIKTDKIYNAADNRQLAADKAQPISIKFVMSIAMCYR